MQASDKVKDNMAAQLFTSGALTDKTQVEFNIEFCEHKHVEREGLDCIFAGPGGRVELVCQDCGKIMDGEIYDIDDN